MSDERGGRYFGPARFFLGGDRVVAQSHITDVRKLFGYMRDQASLGGPQYQVQYTQLPDGTAVKAVRNGILYQAEIISPKLGVSKVTKPNQHWIVWRPQDYADAPEGYPPELWWGIRNSDTQDYETTTWDEKPEYGNTTWFNAAGDQGLSWDFSSGRRYARFGGSLDGSKVYADGEVVVDVGSAYVHGAALYKHNNTLGIMVCLRSAGLSWRWYYSQTAYEEVVVSDLVTPYVNMDFTTSPVYFSKSGARCVMWNVYTTEITDDSVTSHEVTFTSTTGGKIVATPSVHVSTIGGYIYPNYIVDGNGQIVPGVYTESRYHCLGVDYIGETAYVVVAERFFSNEVLIDIVNARTGSGCSTYEYNETSRIESTGVSLRLRLPGAAKGVNAHTLWTTDVPVGPYYIRNEGYVFWDDTETCPGLPVPTSVFFEELHEVDYVGESGQYPYPLVDLSTGYGSVTIQYYTSKQAGSTPPVVELLLLVQQLNCVVDHGAEVAIPGSVVGSSTVNLDSGVYSVGSDARKRFAALPGAMLDTTSVEYFLTPSAFTGYWEMSDEAYNASWKIATYAMVWTQQGGDFDMKSIIGRPHARTGLSALTDTYGQAVRDLGVIASLGGFFQEYMERT